MTKHEAIEVLEEVKMLDDSMFTYSQAYNDALDMAIEALKAQEPVKPTRYQVGRWFKPWRCGACGGTLVFRNGEDKPKYCIDCGKAVKWE